jgi:hypothetical protein
MARHREGAKNAKERKGILLSMFFALLCVLGAFAVTQGSDYDEF